jgi:hypothetical protein
LVAWLQGLVRGGKGPHTTPAGTKVCVLKSDGHGVR